VFGKKQELTKELEEKLNTAEFELEDLQSKMGTIQKCTQQILPFFESQIVAQSEMDKELTKVVSHTYDTIEGVSESKLVIGHLAMELTTMRGQLEDEEKEKKKLLETAQKQREQLDAILEQNDRMAVPVEMLHEIQGGLAEDAQNARTELTQMQEYAKQMTVSTLNCAIEAGRMGEAGKKFVEASEDVRLLSGSYERATVQAMRLLDAMEERIRSLTGQLDILAKACKDSDASVSRLSRGIAEQDGICSRGTERHYLEEISAMSEYLNEISQKHDTFDALAHETLADIENIGESFMNEQEARKELEHIFDQIIKSMRG